MQTETLIIGGGLAGLALASELHAEGCDFLLVEARDRLGGRILTEQVEGGAFDLGPAWFWPGQPRIEALVKRLGLTRFEQYADGILTYEDQSSVQRGQGYASMPGSYRLEGGLGALIDALAQTLPRERVHLGAEVSNLTQREAGIAVTLADTSVIAKRAVLALPPRIAAKLPFTPPLPHKTLVSMRGIATWMAGQAKAVAIYDRPFWREAGLSGDAMSRLGPMVEVHDASPDNGGPFALFGFIGVQPENRRDEALLREQLVAQLGRLFGPEAETPMKLLVEDWAFHPFTSTEEDLAPLYSHPQYGLPRAMAGLWGGRLIFGGSEVAPQFGGYLEGALEAAEIARQTIDEDLKIRPAALPSDSL